MSGRALPAPGASTPKKTYQPAESGASKTMLKPAAPKPAPAGPLVPGAQETTLQDKLRIISIPVAAVLLLSIIFLAVSLRRRRRRRRIYDEANQSYLEEDGSTFANWKNEFLVEDATGGEEEPEKGKSDKDTENQPVPGKPDGQTATDESVDEAGEGDTADRFDPLTEANTRKNEYTYNPHVFMPMQRSPYWSMPPFQASNAFLMPNFSTPVEKDSQSKKSVRFDT